MRERIPGDVMLQPVALIALVLLIVNDHFLKGRGYGLVTGKLSDVAGLVFFPLLLVSLWELARSVGRRSWHFTTRVLVCAIAVAAVGFAAVKLHPGVAHAYSSVIGLRVRADATDLVALPALAVAWFVAQHATRAPRQRHWSGAPGG